MNRKTYEVFFKILADPTRLDIINFLRKGSRNVSEISKRLNLEQSRVSHNLKTLNNYGFLTIKQAGKQRFYSLDKKTIIPLLKLTDKFVKRYYDHLCECNCIKKCGCIGECKCGSKDHKNKRRLKK